MSLSLHHFLSLGLAFSTFRSEGRRPRMSRLCPLECECQGGQCTPRGGLHHISSTYSQACHKVGTQTRLLNESVLACQGPSPSACCWSSRGKQPMTGDRTDWIPKLENWKRTPVSMSLTHVIMERNHLILRIKKLKPAEEGVSPISHSMIVAEMDRVQASDTQLRALFTSRFTYTFIYKQQSIGQLLYSRNYSRH